MKRQRKSLKKHVQKCGGNKANLKYKNVQHLGNKYCTVIDLKPLQNIIYNFKYTLVGLPSTYHSHNMTRQTPFSSMRRDGIWPITVTFIVKKNWGGQVKHLASPLQKQFWLQKGHQDTYSLRSPEWDCSRELTTVILLKFT